MNVEITRQKFAPCQKQSLDVGDVKCCSVMSGSERISRPTSLIGEYRARAVRCREEANRTRLLERRYELEAEAEHLEQVAKEMSAE